jgi:hypothetical protein
MIAFGRQSQVGKYNREMLILALLHLKSHGSSRFLAGLLNYFVNFFPLT